MTCVALHRLEVAIRLQELVGGTGMPQTVEHDLLKLRATKKQRPRPLKGTQPLLCLSLKMISEPTLLRRARS